MTFDEEFTGNALDPTKWKMGEHHLGTLGKAGLNKNSITFKNGALTLTAAKIPVVFGSKYYDYSSATISTFTKFKQKYGYYEARIRYDATLGAWPAFWLMPDHGKEYYGDPEHHKESFIRFDLNKSSPVKKAVLKLKINDLAKETVDNPKNPVIYNLSIHKLISYNWSEKTINWINKPSYDPVWLTQLSGTKDPTVNNQLHFGKELYIDVTQYVNERIRQHQKNIGFALVDTFRKDKRISISSKETVNINNRPKLVVDEQSIYPSDDAYVRSGSHAEKTFGDLPTLDLRNPWQGNVAARYEGGAEIDIFESQGIWKNSLHHALHWFKNKSDTERQSIHSNRVALDSPTNEYHTYGAHWEPGRIRFYVDGNLTATFKDQNVPIISGYIILSHWFGGWIVSGNTAIDDDKLPSTMQVDYVRVWSGQAAKNPHSR